MRRLASRRACLLLGGASLGAGCTTPGSGDPHPSLTRLWRGYQAMPEERALSLAGNPDNVWVSGASGGHELQSDADDGALAACAKRRAARRLRVPCLLYARGDEIVWEMR